MADEKDPLESVKDQLADEKTGDEKTGDEKPPVKETETPPEKKENQELQALDSKVTKLCEDIESWKNQTLSEVVQTREVLKQSTLEALEMLARKPEPVAPQNPPPPADPQELPPSDADGRPEAKTGRKAAPVKKRRLL